MKHLSFLYCLKQLGAFVKLCIPLTFCLTFDFVRVQIPLAYCDYMHFLLKKDTCISLHSRFVNYACRLQNQLTEDICGLVEEACFQAVGWGLRPWLGYSPTQHSAFQERARELVTPCLQMAAPTCAIQLFYTAVCSKSTTPITKKGGQRTLKLT